MENLVRAILSASQPGESVRRQAASLRQIGPCRLIAVGKAARAMATAAAEIVGEQVASGVVIAPPGVDESEGEAIAGAPRIVLHPADHPLPTARNLVAAQAAADTVGSIGRAESLLVLISGGASAMLTLPAAGLTLDDIRAVTTGLMRAGATIDELNCVRKHCEQLKGGGVVRLATAAGCRGILTLILSDVVGDRLDTIGSGPTAPDPTTYAEAIAILERSNLLQAAPAITEHLRAGAAGQAAETLKAGDDACARVENIIIGSNAVAIEAAAAELQRQGVQVIESRAGVTGEAREVGVALASRMRELMATSGTSSCAIIWGGETTVTVRGTGAGGRNQELALAAAIALDGVPNALVMSLATDGIDGNSPAAGAVVTGDTLARAREVGLDAAAALADSDSHTFFRAVDAASTGNGRRILIQTGRTGTNVNDVMVGFAWAEQR